jgi:tubulin monoglycylase TTLL3/8
MNDYLKRQNVSIATKVFCFNSQDEYIRRCLAKHGWIETSCNSQFFDLKWVYTENADDFKTILDG